MARKLVSIQKILEIAPIEGADVIEKIRVLGWWLVTQKSNNFKVGDMVVYFEIDSLIPVRDEFEFLRKSGYTKMADGSEGFRIKTAKFRGQVSQGFALPMQGLRDLGHVKEEYMMYEDWQFVGSDDKLYTVEEGTDLTDLLGVKKYEAPIPACLSGEAVGYIPTWLETDETRVQVLQPLLDKYTGTNCYVTEKLDGSSFSAFIDDEGNFQVSSRQVSFVRSEKNTQWKWAIANDIEAKLRAYMAETGVRLAIQGEIIGESIQKNRYLLKGQDVRLFNAVDMENRKHLGYNELIALADRFGVKTVPILGTDLILGNNIDELVKMAYGKSALNPKADREGIVIRPLEVLYDFNHDVKYGRVSLKVINQDFLLKGGD